MVVVVVVLRGEMAAEEVGKEMVAEEVAEEMAEEAGEEVGGSRGCLAAMRATSLLAAPPATTTMLSSFEEILRCEQQEGAEVCDRPWRMLVARTSGRQWYQIITRGLDATECMMQFAPYISSIRERRRSVKWREKEKG